MDTDFQTDYRISWIKLVSKKKLPGLKKIKRNQDIFITLLPPDGNHSSQKYSGKYENHKSTK